MDQANSTTEINPPAGYSRPTLLTILCILTFLTSVYMVVVRGSDLFATQTPGEAAAIEENINSTFAQVQTNNPEMAETVQYYMDAAFSYLQITLNNLVLLSVMAVIVAVASFVGALWMWRLRKSGFFIYMAAKIVGIAVQLIVYGGNVVSLIVCAIALVVGGGMLLLYGLNLKYMH